VSIDVTWLEENVLHRKLTDSEMGQLDGVIERMEFSSGDTIMTEGESGGALYLLRSGSVEILRDSKGQQQLLRTVYEGALLGELTFLTAEPATATAVASNNSVVYKMNRSGYSRLMQTNQELVYAMFTYILAYTSSMIRQMNEDHAEILDYMTGVHK
jgi:CRP/FNR family cyclic AMP-dependent transcriptional regulator